MSERDTTLSRFTYLPPAWTAPSLADARPSCGATPPLAFAVLPDWAIRQGVGSLVFGVDNY